MNRVRVQIIEANELKDVFLLRCKLSKTGTGLHLLEIFILKLKALFLRKACSYN